jgi:RNA polymerase sigma-70 factor (ECF subfamily)
MAAWFVIQAVVPGAPDTRRDRELLGDLASGSADALAALYDRHAASLYRHAVALTRPAADAEDVVHAVFVKLVTTGAELLGVRAPASYLHRMLHTTWIDGRRRTTMGEQVVARAARETVAWSGLTAGALDDAIDLARLLDVIPVAEREAIVLHLMDGFSFREIGRMTGVSLFTAAGRYRQGIGRLRKLLGANAGQDK